MYRLGKRVLSQYIRTNCQRRLRLDLYRAKRDREAADIPEKDSRRPGLTLLTEQGRRYEREKFAELEQTFPHLIVRGGDLPFEPGEARAFQAINLADHLDGMEPFQFALEAQYPVTPPFRNAHRLQYLEDGSTTAGGHPLQFEELRPDILQVLPPTGQVRRTIAPCGRLDRLPADDARKGLRIIDVKSSGEPSPAHFSELAYYAMALAGWLQETGRSDRYVVLANAAIWPGKHDASTLQLVDREDQRNNVVQRDLQRYLHALEADLETMPPEVVIGRVQRFLRVDLLEVLAVEDWRTLPWHVDLKCAGCDYLGYRWSRHDDEAAEQAPAQGEAPDERYCWPMAEAQGHLSRIAGLSEGASGKLREVQVTDVVAVSALTEGNVAFESHQVLRAKRTVLRQRAQTLRDVSPAAIANRAGTSAILPRFADIRIAVSVDFDIGSGITFAFGSHIDYGVPIGPGAPDGTGPRYRREFRHVERPLLVPKRSLVSEGENLRLWLNHLVNDIHRARDEVVAGYQANGAPNRDDATVQFFLWDRLTFDHLCRVFGRHLALLQVPVRVGQVDVSPMAWVFPAEALLQEAAFVERSSPLSIVADAVNCLMAAPIPHHYGVIDLANSIDPDTRRLADGRAWGFHVNKFYRDPLSDQIPSERGHELWEHASPFADRDYQWHQEMVRSVVRKKLQAVAYVAEKLTRQLADQLTAEAPRVGNVFRSSDRLTGVGNDGQIFYQHARLMAAAQRLEVDLLMAMPPHEREARFYSARIEQLLAGAERTQALQRLELAHEVGADVLVLRLSDRSKEARIKKGEYTWSLLPEASLAQLQDMTVARFKGQNPAVAARCPIDHWDYHARLRDNLTVTILGIDRGERLLAVRANTLLAAALATGTIVLAFDRHQFAIMDPTVLDVFGGKIKKALSDATGIRHPPIARTRPLFPNPGVAHVRAGRANAAADTPAAQFLWNADVMAAAATDLDATPVLQVASEVLPGLTDRQQEAIRRAVERRLSLWWGPPGTGKSRTAQAYIAGIVADAARRQEPLRLAIVGFTWVAIDNVAKALPNLLRTLQLDQMVRLARLCSISPEGVHPNLANFVVSMARDADPTPKLQLEQRLLNAQGITLVASTVDQLAKLDNRVCSDLFDVMLIDEASQLDVAHLIVGLTKLADGGRVTVVGDDMQMAPIHPIDPPEDLEHLLGSAYGFYRHYRHHEGEQFAIEPVMLDRSFRSNEEIVAFVREAGYGDDLHANAANANRRMALRDQWPAQEPADWPQALVWSPHYPSLLDPEQPLIALVHHDRYSSQRNDQEADLVASLVYMLFRAGLMDVRTGNEQLLGDNDFFAYGVGVVTPHRAQQAAVFDRLAAIMPPTVDRNAIFASIDTVERFQGQEKTLMIASFGLGDLDQIAAEESFLYSLNRFNVAASRAQAKFIAIVSRHLVDHLPRDRRVMEESRLLKHYVDGFLPNSQSLELPGLGRCELRRRG